VAEEPVSFDSIRDAFENTSLTAFDVWVIYYSLGGTATSDDLEAYLVAEGPLDVGQERVLAQSINEVFLDADMNHPVPYPART
jgi:hypothetical protein